MGSNEFDIRQMRFEECRLDTFSDWPSDAPVDARKVAKAGFFKTGRSSTEVKCRWCGCILSEWDYGDQVMARHRSQNPNCPFIRNESDNVPLINMNDSSNSNNGLRQNLAEARRQQEQEDSQEEQQSSQVSTDEADLPEPSTSSSRSADETRVSPRPNSASPTSGFSRADLRRESVRLRTFAKWPVEFISPERLAQSGFVYTGSRDCVRCVFCGEYVGEWTPEDDPLAEHRNLFPHCPYMQGQNVGNVPKGQSGSRDEPSTSFRPPFFSLVGGDDETGIRIRDLNSGPEKSANVQWKNNAGNRDEPGVIRHSGPKEPRYSTIEARMRTFKEWPPALKQQPKELAEAGFYYIGYSDQVKCFYCDGGLRNWQPEDDPWTEHSRWFSKCGFVRLVKGDEFIAKCLESRPPEVLPPPPSNAKSSSRDVPSETEVQDIMNNSRIVHDALSIGIEASRIKMAIRDRLRSSGAMFRTVNELVDAAFRAHREQEDRHGVENEESPSAFERSQSWPPPQTGQDVEMTTASREEAQSSVISEEPTVESQSSEPAMSFNTETMTKSNSIPGTISDNLQSLETSKAHAFSSSTDLESENRRLKEQRICKICMDNEIGVVFLPCGHLICCVQCAPALKDCPLCRQGIQGTVKTYMS